MASEALRVPVEHPRVDAVSALLDRPEPGGPGGRGTAVLLANGAGFDMRAPFMEALALGLVARGFPVLRFDYPYKERETREGTRRPPDAAPRLLDAHRAARATLAERLPRARIVLAGKSLGARMSSLLAADDEPCAGLVHFGYPLHAPKRTDRPRSEHFAAIAQPALFLQGTRDALCDLDLLRRELRKHGGPTTLEVVEGADHGFHVTKATGRTDAEVREALLDRVATWVDALLPE